MRLEEAQRIAAQRAYGRCEGCGVFGRVLDPHHRIARGAGGVHRAGTIVINAVQNQIILCRVACHERTETGEGWGECAQLGWRLTRAQNPADVPALLHTVNGYGWWYLTADGGYRWADLPHEYRITHQEE